MDAKTIPSRSGTVTDPDLAVSDKVVIRCPACGASEDADLAQLTGGPTIVCRKCGETWPIAREGSSVDVSAAALARSGPHPGDPRPPDLDGERRPLVGYSDGPSPAWLAKIEGDILPEEPRRRRLPAFLGALAACLFVTIFFAGRQSVVRAAPDLAGLYAAFGMPVNLPRLALGDVEAERTDGGSGARLFLRGTIRNLSRAEQSLPALSARFYALDGRAAGLRVFEAGSPSIGGSATLPFEVELDGVADAAAEVVLRFRRPEEPVVISNRELQSE